MTRPVTPFKLTPGDSAPIMKEKGVAMRFYVETYFKRRNQAHVDTFKTEQGAIQESSRFSDNVEALDEDAAKDIHAERVKAAEPGLIEITGSLAVPYDDWFKRAEG